MKFKYTFTGEEPLFFPTLGVELKKGDPIESDEPLNHPELQEIKAEQPKK